MKKSEQTKIIIRVLMEHGVMVDDRIRDAVKEAVLEIKREEFRQKNEWKRRMGRC